MFFLGTNIDAVPFALMVDIVNGTTSTTVLPVPYDTVSDMFLASYSYRYSSILFIKALTSYSLRMYNKICYIHMASV